MNGIQHPIHEGSGLFGRKLLCQFNGLVEHDFGGSSGGTHFMNRQAQDGAVDGRKPFQPPVFAVLADDFIERSSIFGGAFEELVREFARFVGAFGALPKLCFQFRGILLAHVPLKEHLHRKFARFGAERHVTCAAAIRYGERASLRTRAAYVKAAPFLSPPGPPRSLCSRPSVPRDRWPAPRYRRSARKKWSATRSPSAQVAG